MKTDKLRESQHIDDRRGQTSSQNNYTNASNPLFSALFSRLGWKGKLILVLVLVAFGGISGLGGLLGSNSSSPQSVTSHQTTSQSSQATDQEAQFLSKVLASTEDFWSQEFQKNGRQYDFPTMVYYTDSVQTACGQGSAQAGPFYCSGDQKIYIDLSFYRELGDKYGAKGDFAMAYVVAHEVGHHIQEELGIMSQYNKQRQGLSEKEANALNVRLELQADYYAGAWAKYVQDNKLLDTDDIQEAMTAAHAVGDDTLQKQAYGRTIPDSFTHGTSKQRQTWFNRGYQYGDIQHGDTFNSNI
ncbi:neutral zinc metallopeptidase [Streptococcus saliviloxodontae]|uniref:Metalloprotease n=1 Tax=Streptococcus saliviloxodontae TaxID=1349416 RepID=A0ABS2PMW1_9STRE|nr:neutral zinc metallopeptidase [Streptococcus saliviloxodontae]MBM7636436.1 putative metalloprotease [Streptococcus saliviloxodontae]